MTDLEFIGTQDAVQRNFDRLRGLLPDWGGAAPSIRYGTGSAVWAGGSDFVSTTVTHGLGRDPVAIFVVPNSQSGTGHVVAYSNGQSSTTITVRIATTSGFTPVGTTATPFSWLVIG